MPSSKDEAARRPGRAIFGSTSPLMRLVSVFNEARRPSGLRHRSAAVIPAARPGWAVPNPPIARRAQGAGLEDYSRVPEGALYTFGVGAALRAWNPLPAARVASAARCTRSRCASSRPDWRSRALIEMGVKCAGQDKVHVDGDLDPACRMVLPRVDGPTTKATGPKWCSTCAVRRLVLSEQDRVGIGTFQPKDEKNQDSTELDRRHQLPQRVAEFGSDSDPRAFNFDGEFNIANRGHHRVH